MSRLCTLLAGLLVLASAPAALALDLYLVRHAETLANVTRDYSVFNQRHFSEAGERQVAELTDALRGRAFDAILVSPAYRALRTIQPYLEASGQVAEIWPELDECCFQRGDEEQASDTSALGPAILVEQEMRPFFMLREGSDGDAPGPETYAEGVMRVKRAAALLRERFGDSDATVLVVAHWHSGSRLLEVLMDQAPQGRYRPQNTAATWLHGEGGRYRLMGLNLPVADVATNLPVAAPAPTE